MILFKVIAVKCFDLVLVGGTVNYATIVIVM